MKKNLRALLSIVMLTFTLLIGKTSKSQQSLIQVAPYSWNAYVHLPADYGTTTKSFPTIIFFPGIGEVGTNASAVVANGPGAYITQGWNGNVSVDGTTVEFIVISLQPPATYPVEVTMNAEIQTLKSLYRIDNKRLYLTGLSMGGWCATTFVTGDAYGGPYTYASQVAAVVTVEGMKPDDNSPYPNLFDNFANVGGRYLGFEQAQDGRDTKTVVDRMNATKANSGIYVQTNWGGGGHCCWEEFYGGNGTVPPNYTLDGISQNIYQWMARQSLGGQPTNIAPVANAGADQVIKLPTSSVTLSGTGTDADGTIASYKWTKTSGPSSGTITSPASASTTVTGLVAGTYIFTLTVTDNSGATSTDNIQVTVNPANIAPVANAGANVITNLPVGSTLSITTSVSLTGSGTDPDGTIASYKWAQLSGPVTGAISSPASASTNVTGLTMGVYQFTLTVTDNAGAAGKDTVQVTVNEPPTANAGVDQLISLPATTVTLTGSGTDVDGTIASYKWIKISGPASGTITNTATTSTSVTGLAAGIYKFSLTVTDNSGAIAADTMQVTVNMPPVANAGADQTIKSPVSTATLSGSGTDANGTIASYKWAKVSGPTSGTITNAATATTSLTVLVVGIYKFSLTVTDNNGATGTDTMQLTVTAANIPPVANAGTDQLISLPSTALILTGSGTDADGTIASYKWGKVSGPTSGTITNTATASTTVTGLSAGIYKFTLTVTDNSGAASTDTIQVIVNTPPTANAGVDQLISLPATTTTLNGIGADADGTIASYKWTKASGPTAGVISSASSAVTSVTGLAAGVYKFTLTVTDNNGAATIDTIQVIVNAPPVANAGTDQVITLPTTTVTLSGSGTDIDGTIASYSWAKVSGPTSGTITNAGIAGTTVTGLAAGIYKFLLTVKDNANSSATDTIQVTVNAAPLPPVISGSNTASGVAGTVFSYTITASNTPTSYAATGLPAGLSVNTSTGIISGTPTTAGTYSVTISAINVGGTGTKLLSISITPKTPVISSSTAAIGTVGSAFSYTITASNTPISYTATGLPSGLTVNTSTGVISGTPTAAGTYSVTISAINAGGTGSTTLSISINAAVTVCSGAIIVNTTIAPAIDGTIDATWAKAPTNTITKTVNGVLQPDYAAQWRAMYDTSYLYILVEVKDATLKAPPYGPNPWDDDAVEVYIDGNNNKTTSYDANDHQFGFNWGVAATTTNMYGSATRTGIIYSIPSVTGGYNLAAKIPWSLIGGTAPVNGKQIGFDININDNDGGNGDKTRQATSAWFSSSNQAFTNPGLFGTTPLTICNGASKPLINSSLTASGIIGSAFSYTITASNTPASFTATGLPAGLSINTSTGVISGTPTAAATSSVIISATNTGGTDTKTLVIVINPPAPVISSAATATGTVGTAFSYTITASNTPTSYTATGLPAGLTINSSNGVISGTPTVATTSSVTIGAVNAGGTGTKTLTITINGALPAAPVISSAPTATGTVGSAFSYTITASNTPTSYTATGLPAGLTINTSTGVISGTPTVATSSSVTIGAVNTGGTGTKALTITINATAANNQAPVANAGNHNNLIWALTADKTVITTGPVAGNLMVPGTNFAATTTFSTSGAQCKLSTNWPTVATDGDNIDLPLLPNTGIGFSLTSLTCAVKISGSSGSNLFSLAYQQDGAGSWVPFGSVQTALSGSTGAINFGTLNQFFAKGHTYIIRLYVYAAASGTSSSRNVYIKNITLTGKSAIDISLPTNSITLAGSGTDADGTIASYQWSKLSGPASGTITSASSAVTTVTGLVQGAYNFVLTVTDNAGATGKDTIQVTVNPVGSRPAISSVNELSNTNVNDVQVYPNPVQTTLTAKVSAMSINQEASITLTDISGRALLRKDIFITQQTTDVQIDISRFNKGIYLLNFSVDGKNITRKIVKK